MDGLSGWEHLRNFAFWEWNGNSLAVAVGEVILILIAGLLVRALLLRGVRSLFGSIGDGSPFVTRERAEKALRVAENVIGYGTILLVAFLIPGVLGLHVDGWLENEQLRGLFRAGLIVLGANLVIRLGSLFIDELFERIESKESPGDDRRAVTLRGVLQSILRYTVDITAVVLVLSNLGINVTGILAGIGVVGLALGFGAQNLVRDVISGFFILFEDQFRVGDYVVIGQLSGIIEEMGFRVTKIRDFGGQLHIIPNGDIGTVSNYSRHPMRVLFDVRIAFAEDAERAIQVIEAAANDYAAGDPRILDGPRVLGLADFGESAMLIRVWCTAEPMSQWDVERQLRLAIKKALDHHGIEIPDVRRILVPSKTAKFPAWPARRAAAGGEDEEDHGDGP